MMDFDIGCCLCPENVTVPVSLPDGWAFRTSTVDLEKAFCPDHANIVEFTKAQCPGCVGSWGDCGLWNAFAYRGRRSLTDDDFASLSRGDCPKRVNGTFMFRREGPGVTETELDLSDRATDESGPALAAAIRAYWERYPDA